VSEIPFVKVGQEIPFTVDGFPGRKFSGKVERVNPSAELGSRSISVFVDAAQRRRARSRAACSPTARSPPRRRRR
jgi:multidrug resistance efflux pump